MARNQKKPLDDDKLEGIYLVKIEVSEVLKPHVEYYGRCNEGHQDRNYGFLSQITDKVVRDQHQRRNEDALVGGGGNVTPRRNAMPASTTEDKPLSGGDNVLAGKGDKGKGKGT